MLESYANIIDFFVLFASNAKVELSRFDKGDKVKKNYFVRVINYNYSFSSKSN